MNYSQLSLCLLVVIVTAWAEPADSDILSISFNKVETYLSTSLYIPGSVHHMEEDLSKDDGSILFTAYIYLKSTRGQTATTLSVFYRLSKVPSFTQLNSTHLVIVDQNCLLMINRKDYRLQILAGKCQNRGYVDGKAGTGMMNSPSGSEIDIRNPGKLLVTDRDNHALRSVDLRSGELNTVIKSGLNSPKGMAWFNDKLLVANSNYISQVSWLKDGTVTNERITSGGPSMNFDSPRELIKVGENLYLIVDYGHSNLRLLNMKNRKVGPVCLSDDKLCTKGIQLSLNPMSLLKVGSDVYVGMGNAIYKLIGMNAGTPVKCSYSNITAYVEPSNMKAEVKLHSGTSAVLSLGAHQYKYYTDICSYYVHAIESPVLRTVVFRSQYEVTCNSLNDKSTKDVLQSELGHKRGQLQEICDQDCSLPKQKPWYTCDNNLLTINWPTDKQYSMTWNKPPTSLTKLLRKRLEAAEYISFDVTVINHAPPVVPAKKDSDGESIQIVLASSCADASLTYNSEKDICV